MCCSRSHLDLRNPHVLLQKPSGDARVDPISATYEPPREALGPEPRYFHQLEPVSATASSHRTRGNAEQCTLRKRTSTIDCQTTVVLFRKHVSQLASSSHLEEQGKEAPAPAPSSADILTGRLLLINLEDVF